MRLVGIFPIGLQLTPPPKGGEGFISTRFGPKGPVFEFETRLKHGNARGNYSEVPMQKAPRTRGYFDIIVCFLLLAGAGYGEGPELIIAV